mmetsp:Transcript_16252/g.42978  ORF Transcript_16252/g.42978 Transcript_16252/m.42978 type:complete len:710 (+) Transcript_16252:92-2221(+)
MSGLTVVEGCTPDDVSRETQWKLENDVGIPAIQLFNILWGVILWAFLCGMVHIVFQKKKIQGNSVDDTMVNKFLKSRQFWFRSIFFLVYVAWGVFNLETSCKSCFEEVEDTCGNWRLIFWYGLVLILTSNLSSTPFEFYLGEGVTFVQNFKFYFKSVALPTKEELESVVSNGELKQEGAVGFWTLMPSVFITWIFAKSIFNSANLGGMYGMWGGLAYASWYISFMTAGTVCYLLRTRYGFSSMQQAVYKNYGAVGSLCYTAVLLYRLFNEIWSNATVIGSFYGVAGSSGYWGACWISTLIPAVYCVMGGMRASLFSDVFQAFFAVTFLVVVMCTMGSDKTFMDRTDAFSYEPAVGWYDDGWWACFLGGILQGICSYPFFDAVLIDRGFMGTPKTMLKSFFVGGAVAALFIFWYAMIGVYGAFYHEYYQSADVCGCVAGVRTVASALCPTDWNPCSKLKSGSAIGDSATAAWIMGKQTYGFVEVFVNFIMITASMSTLDSTFTSFAKLTSLEIGGWLKISPDTRSETGPLRPYDLQYIGEKHLVIARACIVFLMLLGVSFLGTEKDAMKATTAAGTMVMGIGAPIWMMTIWKTKVAGRKGWVQAPLAFFVPTFVGFVFGYIYYNDGKPGNKMGVTYDEMLAGDTDGKSYYYSRFLGTNLIGHAVCIALFFIFFAFHQLLPTLWFWPLDEVEPVGQEAIKEVEPAKEQVTM